MSQNKEGGMRIIIFICYLLISSISFAYEFKPIKISLVGSYQQDESNLSYSDERIFDPNAIREFFDHFHIYQAGPKLEVVIPFAFFFRSFFLYGYGHTHKGLSQMRVAVQDLQNIVVARFAKEFEYKASAYTFESSGSVGYPIQLAPFTIIPFFGYGYDRQNVERRGLDFALFSDGVSTARFKPSNHLGSKFYAPFFGLELRVEPTPEGRLIWIGEYEFHWGVFQTNSSYLIQTQTIGLEQNIKQNISLKKRGISHKFFLKTLIGLSKYATLGLKIKYSYLKVNNGQSNQVIFGTENGLSIEEKIQRESKRYTSQYLGGEIEGSIQF